MNIIPPIEYNQRKYWPPVFYSQPPTETKQSNTSLASFGTCAITHFSDETSDIIFISIVICNLIYTFK